MNPSDKSMQLLATPKSSFPSFTLGDGLLSLEDFLLNSKAAEGSPKSPDTHMSSSIIIPSLRKALPKVKEPRIVIVIKDGLLPLLTVSPPIRSQLNCLLISKSPSEKPSSQISSNDDNPKPRVKANGSAPMAAISDKFTAKLLYPIDLGSWVGEKWTPLTRISVEIAIGKFLDNFSIAASSPIPTIKSV